MRLMTKDEKSTKKIFREKGTCSQTMFFVLNREFGYPNEIFERSADPLAGGIKQSGYHCGLLLGSTLAVGSESYRRFKDHGMSIEMAISTTQRVNESFSKCAGSPDCKDITGIDFSNMGKTSKFSNMMQMAMIAAGDNSKP